MKEIKYFFVNIGKGIFYLFCLGIAILFLIFVSVFSYVGFRNFQNQKVYNEYVENCIAQNHTYQFCITGQELQK